VWTSHVETDDVAQLEQAEREAQDKVLARVDSMLARMQTVLSIAEELKAELGVEDFTDAPAAVRALKAKAGQ